MPLPSSPHTRANIRIQQIARYRVSGRLTDKQIAEILGMSPAGLKYLIGTPQYVEEENALLEGHISKMDMELAGNVEALRGHFRQAVPVAARTLLEIVQQKRDLRASLSAAAEILDRDPDHIFSKQSKNVPSGDSPASGEFNPAGSADMIAQMTTDAAKVTVQIRTNGGSPSSLDSNQPRQSSVQASQASPTTIVGNPQENSAQMPLFGGG